MGCVETSVSALVSTYGAEMDVIEEKKKKSSSYVNSGKLIVTNSYVEKVPTFLSYLHGACEISLMVAIDFTQSNGQVADPTSLHSLRLAEGHANDYQQAISSIGDILESYDSNKMFAMYGLGACVGDSGVEQECFMLNNGNEVQGTAGMLQAYTSSLSHLRLGQCCRLSPLLRTISERVRNSCTQTHQVYHVLLIMTRGNIVDMSETIDTIIQATKLPLSVVLVGMGTSESNFSGIA